MRVRRVQPGEGRRLRELRLRALADAPNAFLSSYDDEEREPAAEWDELAAQSGQARDGAVFVADADDAWLGMAGGYVRSDEPGVATVWGMWVDPRARRRGIGRALLNAIADWARTLDADALRLSVTPSASAARSLYASEGFAVMAKEDSSGPRPISLLERRL